MGKIEELEKFFEHKDRFILAFSGGMSSSFLACFLKRMEKDFVAVTVDTGLLLDIEEVVRQAQSLSLEHKIIEVDLLDDKLFAENSTERCYLCKKEILRALQQYKDEIGYDYVLDATNQSGLSDYRAAIVALKEEGILSPLLDIGIGLLDIKRYSEEWGLEIRPAGDCLATRIPSDIQINREIVGKIRNIEKNIRTMGFENVRARVHSYLLRLEFPETDIEKAIEKRREISKIAKSQGFKYVAVDLEGYRGA
jgi:uncharacterized protein